MAIKRMPTEIYKPRPYQADAVAALTKHYKRGKKGTLVLPTAGGKTFTAWNFLKDELAKGKKILWVVHREYLIDQSIEGMQNNGIKNTVSLWTAKEKDDSGDVVMAMIMSTRNLTGEYDWVIYDECHRAAALSYKNLEERITYKKKLGLSATPERLDKKDLDLGNILYQISFGELVKQGYLAKPDVQIIKTGQNFQFTVSGGDISKHALKKLNNKDRNERILKHVLKDGLKGRKILLFGVNIDHVNSLRDIINTHSPNSTFVVHSEQTRAERSESLANFAGSYGTALCNCEVFTEGYDQKDITDIVMARATVSRSLWVQMVGRGARIIPGIKDSFKLWIPIDDINKYAWLARDWCLSEAEIDIEGQVAKPVEHVQQVDDACKELNIELSDHSMSEKLSVVGLATTMAQYKNAEQQTFVLTEDRRKCLALLELYFQNGQPKDMTRKDFIELSYAYCVTAGEFTLKEWKELAWAYHFYSVLDKKKTNAGQDIWQVKWICETSISEKEIADTLAGNIELIKEFNTTVKNLVAEAGSFGAFWENLVKEAMPYIPKHSRWAKKIITNVQFKERSLILQTNLTTFKPSIYKFGETIGRMFSQKIQDENLVVHMRMDK